MTLPLRRLLVVVVPLAVAALALAGTAVLFRSPSSAAPVVPAEASARAATLETELRAVTARWPGVELTGVDREPCADDHGPTAVQATLLTKTPARTLEQLRVRLQARGWTMAAPARQAEGNPYVDVWRGTAQLGGPGDRWSATIRAGSEYPDAAEVTLLADEQLCR